MVYALVNIPESVMCLYQGSMNEDKLYWINLVESSMVVLNILTIVYEFWGKNEMEVDKFAEQVIVSTPFKHNKMKTYT
jgi:hypothetical protein